jgi:predicted MFS family arabinose efflux permease
VGLVATSTLLTEETPAGQATTMVLNRSAMSLGTALGSAAGGLLLAASGYGALGLSALLWCGASAGLVWWTRSPAPLRPLAAPAPTGEA